MLKINTMNKTIYILSTIILFGCRSSDSIEQENKLNDKIPYRHIYTGYGEIIITDKCVIMTRDSFTYDGHCSKSFIYKEFSKQKDSLK